MAKGGAVYTRVSELSEFFLKLQDRATHRDASSLVADAVSELADILGFDSAWYGWAQLDPRETIIHTSNTMNLPHTYFATWTGMADQDLLVEQFLDDPSMVPTYDRYGNAQTDGMEFLSDTYGLKKMATAMCMRPDRTTSFYLSAYRGGETAKSWDPSEREFLQCAVNNISVAAHNAAKLELKASPGAATSAYISRLGNVVVGLADMRDRFGHLWSRSDQDRLPRLLMDFVHAPGEHVLPGEDLIITCEPAPNPDGMDWHCLSLRPLAKIDLLTPREREVAQALTTGKTHKLVARQLGVSPSTIRNQTQSIYKKMGVDSRAGLARLMTEHGAPAIE